MKILKKIFIAVVCTFLFILIIRNFFTTVYSSSDVFSGQSILIYLDVLYSFNWNSDIGNIHQQFGYVTKDSTEYTFHNFPFYKSEFNYFPRKYYEIQWNNSKFLIRENELPFFCNTINSGDFRKYNDWMPFLIQKGKNTTYDFTGNPKLPDKYKDWLFDKPIYARVLEKYPDNFSIKINKGQKDKLFVGCDFYHNIELGSIYTVIQLFDSTAILQDEITFEMSKDSNVDEPIKAIGNGDKYLPSLRDRYDSLEIGNVISTINN